ATYEQLVGRGRGLARALTRLGLRTGDVVAVCGPRRVGLVTVFLAILYAGAVMLVIDRRLPVARKRQMVSAAGARYVIRLTPGSRSDEWLEELTGVTVVD